MLFKSINPSAPIPNFLSHNLAINDLSVLLKKEVLLSNKIKSFPISIFKKVCALCKSEQI